MGTQGTLRPHGGYRKLRSFQVAEVVYDATVAFCNRFIDKRSPTHDQMVQAARSGRQNIGEGSRASGTSSQTELRLVGVARASLEELLLDYQDYLRQRGLKQWDKGDERALKVRCIGVTRTDRTDQSDQSDQSDSYSRYQALIEESGPETAANTIVCLIHQANYLLDRQIAALEQQFICEGGYTEKLAAVRRQHRLSDRTDRTDRTDRSDLTVPVPSCPKCRRPMVLRTARAGRSAGSQFWGCSAYPECRGTRPQ
jgi:four helix bundle suffix protein